MTHQAFFVEVILPFATPKPYTYHIPDALRKDLQIGMRVEVQFGTGRNIYYRKRSGPLDKTDSFCRW